MDMFEKKTVPFLQINKVGVLFGLEDLTY